MRVQLLGGAAARAEHVLLLSVAAALLEQRLWGDEVGEGVGGGDTLGESHGVGTVAPVAAARGGVRGGAPAAVVRGGRGRRGAGSVGSAAVGVRRRARAAAAGGAAVRVATATTAAASARESFLDCLL